jgi:hypothetical protein
METWLAMHGKRRVAGAGAGASASAERDRVKGGLGLGRYGRLKTAAQDPKRSLISVVASAKHSERSWLAGSQSILEALADPRKRGRGEGDAGISGSAPVVCWSGAGVVLVVLVAVGTSRPVDQPGRVRALPFCSPTRPLLLAAARRTRSNTATHGRVCAVMVPASTTPVRTANQSSRRTLS